MKAIDIVLIPSNLVIDYALALNQNLEQSPLRLSREKAMPHISLAMAVVKESNLQEISYKLNQLQKNFSIELEIDHKFMDNSGDLVTGLGIRKSPELMLIHQEAVNLLKPYAEQISPDTKEVFAGADLINYPQPCKWVIDYISKHSAENFNPHITIGFGDIGDITKQKFFSETLALYHLGPYCTCNALLNK